MSTQDKLVEALRAMRDSAIVVAEGFGIDWRKEAAENPMSPFALADAALAQPQSDVSDAMVEAACRALCAHNHWDADEPVTYSGTRQKAKNPDGEWMRQWQMHANDARVILESAAPQPQAAEPVAWRCFDGNAGFQYYHGAPAAVGAGIELLYTYPQPAQDAKDAARYRWLRDRQDDARSDLSVFVTVCDADDSYLPSSADLDSEIDRLIEASMAQGSWR